MFYFLAGFIVFILFVRYLEYITLFVPSRSVLFTPRDKGLAFDDVFFKSGAYRINGWFIKTKPQASTVIYMHGNAGNISDRLDKLKMFHDLGVNVFIFDYRGYGNSQGRPSEEGLYQDAQAAYDYLLTRNDVDKDKIIGYGGSLGGSVAIDLAVHRNLSGLIVDSTFTNALDMAKRIYPMIPGFFIHIKLDSLSKIKNVTVPKLFIHSPTDEVVPYALGRKLFEAAPEPKEFIITDGSHNDVHWHNQDVFVKGLKAYLTRERFING